jgi:hypothetical protein
LNDGVNLFIQSSAILSKVDSTGVACAQADSSIGMHRDGLELALESVASLKKFGDRGSLRDPPAMHRDGR